MLKTKNLATEIFYKENCLIFFDGQIIEEEQYSFIGVEKQIVKDLKVFTYDGSGNPIYSCELS